MVSHSICLSVFLNELKYDMINLMLNVPDSCQCMYSMYLHSDSVCYFTKSQSKFKYLFSNFLLHNLASQSTQLTCCQMIFIQLENYPKEYMYLQKYKWNLGCSSNIFVFICIKLLPPYKFYKHFDCLNHSTIKENRCRLVNDLTEKAMIIRC